MSENTLSDQISGYRLIGTLMDRAETLGLKAVLAGEKLVIEHPRAGQDYSSRMHYDSIREAGAFLDGWSAAQKVTAVPAADDGAKSSPVTAAYIQREEGGEFDEIKTPISGADLIPAEPGGEG